MEKGRFSSPRELLIDEKDAFIKYIKGLTNSQLFWRAFVYVAFIILTCINYEVMLCLSGVGSLILIGAMADGSDDIWWGHWLYCIGYFY
jgi:hypothetical protein